jgi:DNA polymerase-1
MTTKKSQIYTKRIVLLDTHAILHRAYHALPDFTSPTGEPTGALYGLGAFLLKIVEELKPEYIIAAYDLPEPTHRHEAYAAYKGTRQKTDDALVMQLERSKDLLDALSVPRLEVPGFEADDILGTLAHMFKKEKDLEVFIASGDMDTLQLVDGERVKVYTLKKGIADTVIYDEDAVMVRYGFGPDRVADYKGLRGDPSDNIPGIRGIGEKTATELITRFGSIDDLYTTLKKHPEKLAEAGIKPRIIGLITEGEDEARFSRELATIRRDVPIKPPVFKTSWRESADLSKALAMFTELGFRTLAARLRTMLGGMSAGVESEEKEEEVIDPRELAQTAIALWVLTSDVTNPSVEDMLEHSGTSTFKEARTKILADLHTEGLTKVYEDIELPLMPVVEHMEARGILLDVEYLGSLSKRYHSDLDVLAKRIYETAGEEFNLNSPRQLGEVLFEKLKVGEGKGKRTATGQRSTREDELKKYAAHHPIIGDILEYRELQKLLSTYIDNLPTMVDGENRLHAHFSQAGTTTGRISSQSPNMQNIPIKSTRGAAIRRAIIAPKGFTLIAADYSQIELRVAAFLSEDEKLIEVFKEGQDIHTAVAAQVFNVPPDMVDKEMRRRAKAINFGILYGMGANALAEATGTKRSEAQTYLAEYFKRFSGIARYMEVIKAMVHSRGYTETWFGRRRHFEGIRSPLPYVQAQAERMALNAPIQGTQADIIKLAMIHMHKTLIDRGLQNDAFLTLQVHDELVYEVRDSKVPQVAALIRETMEGVMPLEDTRGVPLRVDVEAGKDWGEMIRV